MLTKRRLAVSPVDRACFGGGGGGVIVSYRNGAEHVRPTPVPTEDPPQPMDSRVTVHSFGGAQYVDGYLRERVEYVLAAGVSTDGVAACRVGELPAHHPFANAAAAAASGKGGSVERILFFSGRHRLSEMAATPVDMTSLLRAGSQSPLSPSAVHLRLPTLCLRSPQGLHLAVYAQSCDTVAACASHGDGGPLPSRPRSTNPSSAVAPSDASALAAGVSHVTPLRDRERLLRFEQRSIACMGAGRMGGAAEEATVLFTDHTLVVCGFAESSGGGTSPCGEHDLNLCHAGAAWGGVEDDGFPAFRVLLHVTLPPELAPSGASAVRVLWSGQHTVWILYEDGSLRAMRVVSARPQTDAPVCREGHGGVETVAVAEEEEGLLEARTAEHAGGSARVSAVFVGSLAADGGTLMESRLHVQADTCGSALHYCFSKVGGSPPAGAADGESDDGARLYYGTARLPSGSRGAAKNEDLSPVREILHQQSSLLFGECVHGIRYDGGRYHVLSQSEAGRASLFLTTLPRFLSGEGATAEAGSMAALALRIVRDPEEHLTAHTHRVERAIRAVNSSAAALRSPADVASAVAELRALKQCVYALLCREQQQQHLLEQPSASFDGAEEREGGWVYPRATLAHQSYPQRLLQQLSRKQMEVCVFGLLSQLDCLDDAVDRPLHEALNLTEARAAAVDAQALLKQHITSTTFPSSVETDAVHARLWPTQVTLCIDVILAGLGVSPAHSLAQVLAEAPAGSDRLTPVMALLVLYYSHRRSAPATDGASPVDTHPALAEQQRAEAARTTFLAQCNLPATSLSAWAFASWASDHGLNPCARLEASATQTPAATAEEEETEGRSESPAREQVRCGEEPYVYLLGPTMAHLDAPPLLALLPALVSGLLSTFAMDTAYRLLPMTLALHAAGEPLPPALGLKLLFIALHAKAYRVVETIFMQSRGTVLEVVATQALALAVARTGDVAPIRGLLRIGSPHEKVVEATLAACPDVARREQLLLRLYVLTQRYADALAVCEAIGARDVVEGQRVSTIASQLRSLMPHGNTRYMLSGEGADLRYSPVPPAPTALLPPPPSLALVRADGSGDGGRAGVGRAGLAEVVPTPLESSRADREAELRRATERFAVGGGGGVGLGVHGSSTAAAAAAYGASHPPTASGTATMRPSSILGSLDRPSSGAGGLTARALSRYAAARGGAGDGGSAGVSGGGRQAREAYAAPASEEASASTKATRAIAATAPQWGVLDGDGLGVTCEAVLQRSGRVCGRPRPCPYHDRR